MYLLLPVRWAPEKFADGDRKRCILLDNIKLCEHSKTRTDLEQLQLLLVGKAFDLGSLHICLQAELLLAQHSQGTVKSLLQVLDVTLQLLPLVLQLSGLQQSSWTESTKSLRTMVLGTLSMK